MEGITVKQQGTAPNNWQLATERVRKNKQLTNDNWSKTRISDKEAESLAQYLADKFNNQKFYEWYLRIAYHVDREVIGDVVASAMKGKQKGRLFSYLIKKEMKH